MTIKTDPVFESHEVAKLINYVMRDGKKSVASRIVYKALDQIKAKDLNPLETVHKAISNVAPQFEVKPRRVGGASYLVPMETRPVRKIFLAFNWIVNAAQARSNKEFHSFDLKLAAELTEAAAGMGEAVNKKIQVEKLAEQNKAFAHFKW
ncbi:30S ribosomal protein S7 [Candidatus Roizmanbacteria bacterium RIFCSPLOWO2_02_FULL_39_8]|nr:MAG: 30S ribosomal protein S7 [Candidatus Roizmanbacteria bacterium RIFCSPLOWO2_02_FULL_39_8]